MQPFTISPMTGFLMEDTDAHLPIASVANPKPYATHPGFDFPGGLTPQEEDLLREYGKVFFYEVNIYENGNLIDNAILYPEVVTLHTQTDWKLAETTLGSGTVQQGVVPTLGQMVDLYYYNNLSGLPTDWIKSQSSGNPCNSYEVVFDIQNLSKHNITGGSVPKILYVGFSQNPFTLWQNSSFNLATY